MNKQYSYSWYIQQFKCARLTAEKLLLSIDEPLFLQQPAKGKWSIAECYSHLINFGDLYLQNMEPAITANKTTTEDISKAFPPRWIIDRAISFFEPPYTIKIKTTELLKPDSISGYNQHKLFSRYLALQDRFVNQLAKAREQQTNLGATKVAHPVFPILKITLSECFALAEVHQRRHQWQAEQALKVLKTGSDDKAL